MADVLDNVDPNNNNTNRANVNDKKCVRFSAEPEFITDVFVDDGIINGKTLNSRGFHAAMNYSINNISN